MSTYNEKKKLLDDNKDLYISEYDKALPSSALGGIIEAKKSYKAASDAGDALGMKKANDKANTIRKNSGGYTGGTDGSEQIRISNPYEVRINDKYVSPYEKDKKRILSLIDEKGEFSYDPLKDPVFEIYKNLYTRLGDEAYDRALANGALRTGGVVSTSAQSAAMQAKNRYNTMLTSKVPELYEAAYERYKSEYERLYDELDLLNELDDSSYKKYRDTVSDWESDRDYYYKKDKDLYDRTFDAYEYNSNLEYKLLKDSIDQLYKEERDSAYDEKWQKEFDSDEERWQKDFENNENNNTIKNAIDIAKIIYGKSGATVSNVKKVIELFGY